MSMRIKRKLTRDGWEPTNLTKREWAFLQRYDQDLYTNLLTIAEFPPEELN